MKLWLTTLLMLSTIAASAQEAEEYRLSEKYRATLSVFGERPLAPATGEEIFRIIVVPTFSHPLSIRVEKNGESHELVAKRLSGKGGYEWGTLKDERRRKLRQREWDRLVSLVGKVSFWQLASTEDKFEVNAQGEVTTCLDSTTWILEGATNTKAHAVERYCPDGKGINEVGLYMVKLSKWKIKKSELR